MLLRAYSESGDDAWALPIRHVAKTNADPSGLVRAVTAVGTSDDVIVGGEFYGQIVFGAEALSSVDEPAFEVPGGDLWLARISSGGHVLWGKALGGPGLDRAISVACAGDLIVVAGKFHEQIDLGTGELVSVDGPGTMPGFAGDVFVAGYALDGTNLWARSGGGLVSDTPAAIAIDASGVTVVGSFGATASFGGTDLTSAGGGDALILRYTTAGDLVWAKSLGTPAGDAALGVAHDDEGNIIVVGFVEGPVDFGGGARPYVGGHDAFVAKYDPSGAHIWSNTFGGPGRDHVTAVAVSGDRVIVAGSYEGAIGTPELVSRGETDAFVVWLDYDDGAPQRAISLGGAQADGIASITLSSSQLYFGGFFLSDADLAGGVSSRGGIDGFVARVQP